MSNIVKMDLYNGIYRANLSYDKETGALTKTLEKVGKAGEVIPSNCIFVKGVHGKRYLDFKKIETKIDDFRIKRVFRDKEVGKYMILLEKKKLPAVTFQGGPFSVGEEVELVPKELSKEDFFEIKADEDLETDETGFINNPGESLRSVAMNDCITVFAIEKTVGKISRILGCHMSSETDHGDMQDYFADLLIEEELDYEIVIIGGNDSSKGLKERIEKYLPHAFPKHEIIGIFYNLLKDSPFSYISADMDSNGSLIYCKHN